MKFCRLTFSRWVITLAACSIALPAASQSFGDLPAAQQAQALQAQSQQTDSQQIQLQQLQNGQINRLPPPLSEQPSQTSWQQGTYGPLGPDGNQLEDEIQPFGAELFSGGFRGVRADGLNPQYQILPGDQITLRVWGAIDIDRILPVDAQGNIFIPTIGPVKVMGASHSQLDGIVRNAVRRVYSDNVSVYTNLQGVQPVAVFVTGFVNKPGRYAGVPSDSILYFIDQASGVDNQLGSYRNIRLIRNGETLAVMDLYQFLLHGELAHDQLQSGDTILIEERGPVVTVHGDVGRPYHYELNQTEQQQYLAGEVLTELAQLNAGVSHALIRGMRDSGPIARYLPLSEFNQARVANGDEVMFFADHQQNSIVVQLEGEYLGPSHFVLPKDAMLHELLNIVAIEPELTDFQNISLRRLSVAERQKQALDESLRRLETTYLGAPSATAEESAIRAREAELISEFVAQAREIQPNGRMVLAHNDNIVDLRLQDGDIITIPSRSDAILVSGEVYIPQAVVYVPGRKAMDYIEGAGGFSQHADEDRVLVVRQNGEVRNASDVTLRPGDEILVLPAVTTKNLQLAASITQILYQVAIAAKVVLDL
ncbi:polysaccharide biosynthesis/export family protein [Arsukibacterium sp.]|uniref:polysaccharide biosynthesis/export family protein n=1 Tax=Arsukibacterium sp. TaxID=1977258 RepID=UPI001BD61AFA|nr:polysaccharide biosynthesis/export family protein [Arsukibacterium sp.]